MTESEDDDLIPFDHDEAERLVNAVVSGYAPEKPTEFEVRKFVDWASRARADELILRDILNGTFVVSKIKHLIEETCEFHVSVASPD